MSMIECFEVMTEASGVPATDMSGGTQLASLLDDYPEDRPGNRFSRGLQFLCWMSLTRE